MGTKHNPRYYASIIQGIMPGGIKSGIILKNNPCDLVGLLSIMLWPNDFKQSITKPFSNPSKRSAEATPEGLDLSINLLFEMLRRKYIQALARGNMGHQVN